MFEEIHPVLRAILHQIRGLVNDADIHIHLGKANNKRKPQPTDKVEFHVSGHTPAEVAKLLAATEPDRYRWGRLSVLTDSLVVTAGEDREIVT